MKLPKQKEIFEILKRMFTPEEALEIIKDREDRGLVHNTTIKRENL